MSPLVEIENLSKRFGPIHAVEGVSFTVDRGDVLGFLGPNGAGKSTTMKMLTCFLPPSHGTARVGGHDIRRDPVKVRAGLGYLPEGAPAYPDMTVAGFLEFVAEIRGFRGPEKKQRIDRAVELVKLGGVLHQTIETLSKGFKRRVGLAQAILHDPEILILDEPTDGLDPNQKHEVRALIKEMAKDKVIILSTHILEEVDAVCNRAIIIDKGRIIFDGTPSQLEAKSRYHRAVTLIVHRKDSAAALTALKALSEVSSIDIHKTRSEDHESLRIFPRNGASLLGPVSEAIRTHGWSIEEMHSERGRLDEVFRALTTGKGDR